MFKTNKKVELQTYLKSHAGDLESSPWEKSSMLKPMTPPDWFKTMSPRAEVEPHINTASSLIREALSSFGFAGLARTLRVCPSFINLLTTGYVIHNKVDVAVNLEGGNFNFHTFNDPDKPSITSHNIDQFTPQFPFENGFTKFTLKFQSEWMLRSSRDVTLMVLPCWWDSIYNNMRAVHGMIKLTANLDWSPHMNTIVRVPNEGEEYLIPADSPIAHIIPMDLADVSLVHNQNLEGDSISKKTMGMLAHVNNYAPLSGKVNSIAKMFRVNKNKS
jgi:hypothetical protein